MAAHIHSSSYLEHEIAGQADGESLAIVGDREVEN